MNKKLLPLIPFLLFYILGFFIFKLSLISIFKISFAYIFTILMASICNKFILSKIRLGYSGYPVAKLMSFLFFGYLVWISQLLLSMNVGYLIGLSVLVLFFWKYKENSGFIKENLELETIASFVFLFFLLISSLKPELNWGEKPMDISLLSYLYREGGQINEPWFSGEPLKYYYYGYFIFAKYLKLFSIPPLEGYYFILSLIASNFFLIFYGIFLKVGFKKNWAKLGPIVILFSSSSQSIINLFNYRNYDFHYFWGNTRIFEQSLFAEFPFWSFVFGDLHPHVISYPFFGLMLWFIIDLIEKKENRILYFQCASFIGVSLAVINSWDVFILGPLYVGLFLGLYKNEIFIEKNVRYLLSPIFTGLLSLVLFLPLIKMISLAGQSGHIIFYRGIHNSVLGLLKHQGVQLLSILILLGYNFKLNKSKDNLVNYIFITPLILLLIIGFVKTGQVSYSIYLMATAIIFLMINQKAFSELKYIFPLGVTCSYIYVISEHVQILDRINSLFKLNNLSYILSSLISLFLLFSLIKTHKIIQRIILVGLASIVLISTMNTYAVTRYKVTIKDKITLNGKVYLDETSPGDSLLIDFINKNIKGTPTLLESSGKAYDYLNGRIQWFTGLKGFLVWSGQHLTQRGISHIDIQGRERVISKIYNSHSIGEKYGLLKSFKIDYVVVGTQERKKFNSNGLKLFSNNSDKFEEIFRDNKSQTFLYKVK